MVVAFTGQHTKLSEAERHYIQRSVINYGVEGEVDTWVSGCAFNVDTVAALTAWGFHYDARHRLCVPKGKWHNKTLVQLMRQDPRVLVDEVEGGYLKRNDHMIALADVLLAFPRTMNEELRSGTWATIRRARNAGVPVEYRPLDRA